MKYSLIHSTEKPVVNFNFETLRQARKNILLIFVLKLIKSMQKGH